MRMVDKWTKRKTKDKRMNKNNVVSWLEIYFDKKVLEEKRIEPIMHFSLLWNLFEHEFSKYPNQITPRSLIELAVKSCRDIPEGILNETYDYFFRRYTNKGEVKSLFNKLLLGNYSGLCKNILLSNNPSKKNKAECVLLIMYRFRNNLFHGNKTPSNLNLYENQFKVINKFLMNFIEATAEKYGVRRNRQELS